MQADKLNDATGAFKRATSVFRDFISADGPFYPEANRYHLYVAYAVSLFFFRIRMKNCIFLILIDHLLVPLGIQMLSSLLYQRIGRCDRSINCSSYMAKVSTWTHTLSSTYHFRTKPDSETDLHCGWVFRNPTDPPLSSQLGHGSFPCDHCIPDTVNGNFHIFDHDLLPD